MFWSDSRECVYDIPVDMPDLAHAVRALGAVQQLHDEERNRICGYALAPYTSASTTGRTERRKEHRQTDRQTEHSNYDAAVLI